MNYKTLLAYFLIYVAGYNNGRGDEIFSTAGISPWDSIVGNWDSGYYGNVAIGTAFFIFTPVCLLIACSLLFYPLVFKRA